MGRNTTAKIVCSLRSRNGPPSVAAPNPKKSAPLSNASLSIAARALSHTSGSTATSSYGSFAEARGSNLPCFSQEFRRTDNEAYIGAEKGETA